MNNNKEYTFEEIKQNIFNYFKNNDKIFTIDDDFDEELKYDLFEKIIFSEELEPIIKNILYFKLLEIIPSLNIKIIKNKNINLYNLCMIIIGLNTAPDS